MRKFDRKRNCFSGIVATVIATKKGVNILERGSQVHFMAKFQDILDFPHPPN